MKLHYRLNSWLVLRSGLMSPRNKSWSVNVASVPVSLLVAGHLLGQQVKHQAPLLLRWVKRNSILDTVKGVCILGLFGYGHHWKTPDFNVPKGVRLAAIR